MDTLFFCLLALDRWIKTVLTRMDRVMAALLAQCRAEGHRDNTGQRHHLRRHTCVTELDGHRHRPIRILFRQRGACRQKERKKGYV